MEGDVPNKVMHIDSIGQALQDIEKFYRNKQIRGMLAAIVLESGEVHSFRSLGGVSYMECLGMVEMLRQHLDMVAFGVGRS